jgi:ribosomal protein S30
MGLSLPSPILIEWRGLISAKPHVEIAWSVVTCLSVAQMIWSLFNNALHPLNMEANQGSDALRYPLHTTPYLRCSSTAFNQPLSSSSFVTASGQPGLAVVHVVACWAHHYLSPTCKCLHLLKPPYLLHVNGGWIKTQTKRINPRDRLHLPPRSGSMRNEERRTINFVRTTLENRARTKPICRNAFLQLLPHVFSRCASSTAIAHSRAANSPPSFARPLKPGEINCSGAMKRRLDPVSAVFHKFSPRFRASRIVSELITDPFSPNFSITLACRECL